MNIAGRWSGGFDGLCLFDPLKYGVNAEFRQEGSRVVGEIRGSTSFSKCTVAGSFQGELTTGAVLTGRIQDTVAVSGRVTESNMTLDIRGSSFFGKIALHR